MTSARIRFSALVLGNQRCFEHRGSNTLAGQGLPHSLTNTV